MTDETNPAASADDAPERRKRLTGGRHAGRYTVKVSETEGGILERIAAEQHVSVPRLMFEAAISSERRETPTERKAAMAELFTLHRLLASISNNVNQIAKATNATHEMQAELQSTLDAVRRTAIRIDDAIDGMSIA